MNLRNGTIAHALNGMIVLPSFILYIYIYISFIYATYFGILLTTVTSTKLCKCRGIKHASEVLPVDNVKNQKHIINPKQYIWLK